MGLERRVKRAVLRELGLSHQRGRKREKSRVMEEFIGLTGYNRSYASWLLRGCGGGVVLAGKGGEQVALRGEVRKIRRRVYDEEFRQVLFWLWELPGYSTRDYWNRQPSLRSRRTSSAKSIRSSSWGDISRDRQAQR